jgi:glycine/sarcosine N-methyltransferase
MKFYDELSKVYDIVFKKEESTVEFLKKKLEPGSKVLDLACGTGTYSIELAKEGHNVAGVDLDAEMIKLANLKAEILNTRFIEGDMRKIKEIFQGESFNMIFCIGNSLVHLQDRNEVRNLLKDAYDMLEGNGELIIQIINFDRVIKRNIKSLPTIDRSSEGVKFIRNYRHEGSSNIIYFDTELIISREGKEITLNNTVPLLPIQSEELTTMLKEAGFDEIILSGGFSEKPFNEDSYALVIRAYK